jgi:hypothetical protein
MDGETFADGEWIDKSGNGNNNLYTQNIELSHQKGLNGCNAFQVFDWTTNNSSSLVLGRGWPHNNQYTFFHVTVTTDQ